MHVQNLPIESAFVAEQRGGIEYRGWNEAMYQNAALINAIRTLQYIFVLANIDPNKRKPSPPEPYPLPGNVKPKKVDSPGSFAFIAMQGLKAVKKRKAGNG